MTATAAAALDTGTAPYWVDAAEAASPRPALPELTGDVECDLLVVGGGFTGLWTALQAVERDPGRSVVLVEADRVGRAATGRNGGFCEASLTHGFSNGMARFPDEMPVLERLGLENLDAIEATVARYGIDCDLRRTGSLDVATAAWQLADLAELAEQQAAFGHDVTLLDRDAVQAEVRSPTYLGGLLSRGRTALVDPYRLATGLLDACLAAGVHVAEGTPAGRPARRGAGVTVPVPGGTARAGRVALAAGVFPATALPRVRRRVVPVYDYVLVTEPLTAEQRGRIGWAGGQGIADAGNLFHYYRPTADGRILWGGYDAVHQWGTGVSPERYARPATFRRLARHFVQTFPDLADVSFTHAWGGAIDTCSRFCPFWVTSEDGRVASVAGYTGLGVGSSRFGAGVLLDLLDGRDSPATRLSMVSSLPLPFPPEPARYAGIALTRWSLARSDRRDGRRNLWLRGLDRVGLGFDS